MGSGNWDLPETVRLIAEVIGREQALYLAGHVVRWDRSGHYGKSSYLYVPRRLTADHRLVHILGWESARRLAAAIGGETLPVAPCKSVFQRFRDAEVRRMASAGASNDNIANIFGLTVRHVRGIKAA